MVSRQFWRNFRFQKEVEMIAVCHLILCWNFTSFLLQNESETTFIKLRRTFCSQREMFFEEITFKQVIVLRWLRIKKRFLKINFIKTFEGIIRFWFEKNHRMEVYIWSSLLADFAEWWIELFRFCQIHHFLV